MVGQQGTKIQDETPMNTVIRDYQNRQPSHVTLHESSINMLCVQLDCDQQNANGLRHSGCNITYRIDVRIDLNDDGKFDESESRAHHRSSSSGRGPQDTYELEIWIPPFDGKNIRTGQHRMRLTLMPNEDYQKICGNMDYIETREYTVNIIPKAPCEAAALAQPIDIIKFICSSNPGRIKLVLICGEEGTFIQDETSTNAAISNYENRHQVPITFFADTIYLLRIHLDCPRLLGGDSHETDCNLAHHVDPGQNSIIFDRLMVHQHNIF
ncbi:unnamed protein product [Rotaria sp. Silwood1]|nr:unnamed protein product [Rotaria sp. Silwood1]